MYVLKKIKKTEPCGAFFFTQLLNGGT